MASDNILNHLTEGTVLAGPHWTEPVRILTAKARDRTHFDKDQVVGYSDLEFVGPGQP